jgi:uncharacterized protein YukE
MKITADFDGLKKIKTDWKDSSKKIFSIEEEMRNILKSIPSEWIGSDSTSYMEKSTDLINEIHTIGQKAELNGEFFETVLNEYEGNENKYSELIGKV